MYPFFFVPLEKTLKQPVIKRSSFNAKVVFGNFGFSSDVCAPYFLVLRDLYFFPIHKCQQINPSGGLYYSKTNKEHARNAVVLSL